MIIFTTILILFFVLRIFNLTGIPVFVDEAIYIRWSQIMRAESTLRFLPLSDGKQPLFMWITMPFLKFISDPLIAGRLVSIMAGFSSLVAVSLLTYLLTNKKSTAAISALIYAILPYTVFFDRMALVDGLLASFGLWSLIFGILTVKTLRLDTAMLLGFSLGFGLLTKSPAIFFYSYLPVIFLFFHQKIDKKSVLKFFGLILVALIISQAMYNILRLGPNFHLVNSRNQDYLFSFSEVLTHPLNPLIRNLKESFSWMFIMVTPFLLWLTIPAFIKSRKSTIFLLTIFFLPLISQASVAKVYTTRYILFCIVVLIPIFAIGLSKFKNKHIFPITLVSLTFPIFLSIWQVTSPNTSLLPKETKYGYFQEWTAGWGQKEVGDYLINLGKGGQKIVVVTEGFFGSLPDGLQIYTQKYQNITVIGSPWPVREIPDNLSNSLKDPKNIAFLVLNKSRNELKPSDLQRLKLIASYDKTPRPDGSIESLQLYQLIK